jgi:phospholipid/cholesterol/gamma-HCH transport system substrate-binding protein
MKQRNLEAQVGGFVLVGLLVAAGLVIMFGRFGQFFQTSYQVRVEFSNASGIIKNSQVLYRGAKVGQVESPPVIIRQGEAVEISLRINSGVKIPQGASFRIGSYGLLGDRFVDVIPPKPAEDGGATVYLQDGDVVKGSETKGVDSLLASAEQKLEQFDKTIREIQAKLLTDAFIEDIHGSARNARSMLERGDKFMAEAEAGRGPLYTVMKDEKTAADLRALIYNLRTRGILFYRDVAAEEERKAREEARKSRPVR